MQLKQTERAVAYRYQQFRRQEPSVVYATPIKYEQAERVASVQSTRTEPKKINQAIGEPAGDQKFQEV